LKLKILLIFNYLIYYFILSSCHKSNNSNNSKSYSGPAQCNLSKSKSIMPQIVGGNPVNGTTIPTGNNTVAILLPLNSFETILCSGTIVANNLILTAGHCFDNVDQNNTSPGVVVFSNSFSNYTSSNSVNINCWQRTSNYIPCSVDDSYNCILNDIAWVKINGTIKSGYSSVSILSNPTTISNTETKTMIGFGDYNDSNGNTTLKNAVSVSSVTFPDTLPSGAASSFDSYTFSGAYENYLTVIGPDTGKGTCEGDSGGPVYVQRGGNYILAALTQGSNSLLSPHPTTTSPPYSFNTSQYASCSDGYGVYTTIGNYVNWIQSSSGVTLSLY